MQPDFNPNVKNCYLNFTDLKILKHIISITIWTVLGLYLLFVILINTSYVQQFVGSQAAALISDKLGTTVHIGKVNLGFFNRFIIDDVLIYDQAGKEMLKATRMSARIELLPLADGKISISSVQVFGSHIALYQTAEGSKPNFQFVIDSLASKDTTSSKPLDLRVNSFIMQRSSVKFDRYDVVPTNGIFNPSHIYLKDISAHISLKALRNDSINLAIKKIAMTEQSGLTLNRLSLKLEGGKSHCTLHDFKLKLPATDLRIGEITADYKYDGDKIDLSTLSFKGAIDESVLSPTDIISLLPQIKTFKNNTLTFKSTFDGTYGRLRISSLNVRSEDNEDFSLEAKGWISKQKGHRPEWSLSVNDLGISQELLALTVQSMKSPNSTLQNVIPRIGNIHIEGTASSSNEKGIGMECRLSSEAGDIDLSGHVSLDKSFSGSVKTDNIDLKRILDDSNFGTIATTVDMKGRMSESSGISEMKANGVISQFEYKSYQYSNILLDGEYDRSNVSARLKIEDPNVALEAEGAFAKSGGKSDVRLKADVHRIMPQAINLSDKWGGALFSARLKADVRASNVNDAVGLIDISDLSMVTEAEEMLIRHINITSGFNDDKHFYLINSDFGNAGITGTFDYHTLTGSLTNFLREKLPTLPGLPPLTPDTHNDFYIRVNIVKTDWLEKLFGIPLQINKPLTLTGKLDDEKHDIFVNSMMPDFVYDGKAYKNASISITKPGERLYGDIRITKIMDNGDMMNLNVSGSANDNNLSTTLTWSNDAAKRQSGKLNAVASFSYEKEAYIDIKPSHININDTTWNIEPSKIVYSKDKIEIDRFAITNNRQHIIINGTASKSPTDTLSIDLSDIDIDYILDLVNFHSVDFSGKATGKAYISAPLSDMGAKGQVEISDFTFENGRMGTLNANVEWNKTEDQIDIQAVANDGPDISTYINGYVSPGRSYIDLQIEASQTRIEFIRSFTESFMSDISGNANGVVRLAGPLSNMNLTGMMVVNGSATISPLNCKYNLRNDTIVLVPDEIKFHNAEIFDTENNRGTVNGSIYHQHLTHLSYNLSIDADNLLAYNFDDFGDDTFYGTVYGSGNVRINGRSGEVTINANVTPQRNSQFVYNASNPDAIVNQEFIQWRDHSAATTSGAAHGRISEIGLMRNMPTDIRIILLINCTPDATLKLLMDSRTNDYITLHGHGVLRATYYNKGAFSMFGTYTVDHGTYSITIQDIIKKSFTFNEGGTIMFGGDPYEANLNLQAIHTVNGVSLSDLNIGNSFSNNTTKVNCLMNITGQPRAPQLDFDIDLPNVSTDEKQMIRSIINSEDEMSQQVLYLLGVGRFYPQEANNATMQNENQQSQTSLAMQSLLSGTISSQINSVLNSVINSSNWNFGANISTGDEGWNNAEYEGLLSGRLLNNRLLINGQFGYRDNANTANTSSFIGDFDIRYLLLPNGNIAINVYNKTNDRYFTKSSLNTQGIGIIMKKDFNGLGDLLGTKRKKKESGSGDTK